MSKCKACNGKGYFTGCVYESDEVGFVDKDYECAVCHGTGQIEQTNEEWFNSLQTSDKAKVLSNIAYSSAGRANEILYLPKEAETKKWELWLKEVHK